MTQTARFDSARVGAQLALEQGNTVLTYTGACNADRAAWLTAPKSRGERAHVECLLWGDAALTGVASIGLGISGSIATTARVGDASNTWGYRVGDGQIVSGGSVLQNVPVGSKGQIVSVDVDILATGEDVVMMWALDGVMIAVVTLPAVYAQEDFYLGATLSGAVGYDLRCLANTGQRAFEFPTANPAWMETQNSAAPVRIADRGYLTPVDADTPNARYRGALVDTTQVAVVRGVSFPMWPQRRATATGELVLANGDSYYDDLTGQDIVGANLTVAIDGSASGVWKITDVTATEASTLRVGLAGATVDLATPLQTRLVRPDADPSSADKPWPLAIGCVRSIDPVLLDGEAQRYALTDGIPLGLGKVRTMGDVLDSTTDYTFAVDGTLTLTDALAGTLTADISTIGGGTLAPATDLLAGDGAFDDAARWTLGGTRNASTINAGHLTLSYTPGGRPGSSDVWARHVSFTPTPGQMYRIRAHVTSLQAGPASYPGLVPSLFFLYGLDATTPNPYARIATVLTTGWVDVVVEAPNAYPIFVYLPDQSYLGYDGPLAIKVTATIDDLAIYAVDATPVDDDVLEPATLETALRVILEGRLGWTPDQWSASDAAAIDTATGYAGIGYYTHDAGNVGDVLRAILDSYHADAYIDRAGVLRIVRIVSPTSSASRGTFEAIDDIRVTPDAAAALTIHASGRRNWRPLQPNEIVTDTAAGTGVPLAERAMLGLPDRITCTFAGAMPASRRQARYADPFRTLLDRRADIQAWADYTGALYPLDTPRRLFVVPVDNVSRFAPGDVWTLVDARYGLAGGKSVFCVEVAENLTTDTGTITCWG